ncbi:hypothetical protein MKK84_15965 [Methylobacterium sp. E-065]|uniref:hypothetical protein n=1 Tax=Methylobacterium sp. E-065 TaxID=2836583 RepID=UPI001FBA57BB|nr:hypothetical protein [Methylobacterium sp. E-065]MCJ2018920.1 hypothetical protein [Methylobacterium sp. E-065]
MIWLGIWLLLSVLAGMEIGRIIGWGNPTPSAPEPARPTTSSLVGEVLARGRADGLNDRQLAGGIQVVLQSHGFLPREEV